MDLQLTGRAAVVTGGSLGLGRATARELAAEGATVVITARRLPPGTHREGTGGGDRRPGPPVRVGHRRHRVRTRLVRRGPDELGRVDILVNGAAAPSGLVRNSVEEADPELLLADINTKVVGYFRCAQAVTPHMKAGGYGRIINIGGLTGRSSHALSGMRNLASSI